MITLKVLRTAGLVAAASLMAILSGCSDSPQSASGENQGSDELLEFEWGVPTASYLAFYVAQDEGYFEEEGLAPNIHSFTSGAPLLPALQSKSLDIATTGVASVFALGQGIDIRYFAFEGDASASEGLVALPDGDVQSLEDLGNGSPIGIPTGTCAQVSAYFAAEEIGIDYTDINAVDIAPNLFANSFESRSIDAGIGWSPYSVDLSLNGFDVIGWDEEWVPGGGACPEAHLGRSEFLDENPEVPVRIVRALDKAWDTIREDPSVAAQALVARMEVSEETGMEVVSRYVDAQPSLEDLLDPETRYAMVGEDGLVEQLKIVADAFADLGVLEETLTTEELVEAVDSSAVEKALGEEG